MEEGGHIIWMTANNLCHRVYFAYEFGRGNDKGYKVAHAKLYSAKTADV